MATLVQIHGMWGQGPRWKAFGDALEQAGHEVHRLALRHHDVDPADPPPKGLGATSLLDYADDLEAEIAKLGEKPILVSHSMGALLAQMLAARGVARGAILLTPAPPSGWPATLILLMPSVLRIFFWTIVTKALFFRPHRPSLKSASWSFLNGLDPAAQKEEHAALVHESGRVVFEIAFWYLDPKRASRVRASDVTCPTLTVAAGHDRITPAASVRATARRYANSGGTLVELPDNAHMVHAEANWREVLDLCLEWISMHAPAKPVRAKTPAKPKTAKRSGRKPAAGRRA